MKRQKILNKPTQSKDQLKISTYFSKLQLKKSEIFSDSDEKSIKQANSIDKSRDSDDLMLVDKNVVTGKLVGRSVGCTPEKTLGAVADVPTLKTLYDGIRFKESDRDASPPHSTPLESLASPDVIPPTPDMNRFKLHKSAVLPPLVEEDIPAMLYRSPPKKKYKSDPNKLIVNLSDVSAKHFEEIHSLSLTNDENDPKTPPKPNRNDAKKSPLNNVSFNAQENKEFASDDDWADDFILNESLDELDLESWSYCTVLEVERDPYGNQIVKLQSVDDNKRATCKLTGLWRESKLNVRDRVNVIARKTRTTPAYCVDNDGGYLVYSPDLLISGTSVVGSLFCKRRSVLADRFRLSEINSAMLIGCTVHTLLESVLKRGIQSADAMETRLMEMLSSREMLSVLYGNKTDVEQVRDLVMPYIPNIKRFLDNYVTSTNVRKNGEDWRGCIASVEDVEENIWCVRYGIKGKVDITVRSTAGDLLPLELKTGRASMSLEHRGQVIIYTMIMSQLGCDVRSGLLLYLKENVLREIDADHREKRDLVMLRNDLAYYLEREPRLRRRLASEKTAALPDGSDSSPEENLAEELLAVAELPPPIDHRNACTKCPYNIVCSAYLSAERDVQLREDHPLRAVSAERLAHLKPEHIGYFLRWTSLLSLEHSYRPTRKQLKDIWRLSPEEREEKGGALCFLTIAADVQERGDSYLHTFRRIDSSNNDLPLKHPGKDFLSSGLAVGNYIVVSTDMRVAVAAGFVTALEQHSITVSVERDLSQRRAGRAFHVDTYESQTTLNFSMSALAALLEPTARARRLRSLIVDRESPVFNERLPRTVMTVGRDVLRRLNKVQQRAVLKAIIAQDYLLIKGMPGSGKTATIVALVQLLVALGQTVLITSHTHSAVDNVCLRLVDCGVDLLRLGNVTRVHPGLRHRTESVLTADCTTVPQLQRVYEQARVVAVTCWMADHPMLSANRLDVCIVDESTQVAQPSVLKALLATDRFVLVGDPDQLPPVINNPDAVKLGMGASLFERLASPATTINLTLQYRMNKTITALANRVTYRGQLLCADDGVAHAVFRVPRLERLLTLCADEHWLTQLLDGRLQSSVMALDTGGTWRLGPRSQQVLQDVGVPSLGQDAHCTNLYEAAIVVTLLKALREGGVLSSAIGVIAPYRAQVTLLAKVAAKLAPNDEPIEVNTVDQYQGRDKEIIVYSCTRSKEPNTYHSSGFEILEDKRRLTVAITRAKHKLIIIGDFDTLRSYAPFKLLLDSLSDEQKLIDAPNNHRLDFDKILGNID